MRKTNNWNPYENRPNPEKILLILHPCKLSWAGKDKSCISCYRPNITYICLSPVVLRDPARTSRPWARPSGFSVTLPVSAQLSRRYTSDEAFCPGPPRRFTGLRLAYQSVGRSSGLHVSRCVRPSLFLDNRPCTAGLGIWLSANKGEGVALADGFRIISEPRKTGYMNEQTVSAVILISQWLIDDKSWRDENSDTPSFHDDRKASRRPCRDSGPISAPNQKTFLGDLVGPRAGIWLETIRESVYMLVRPAVSSSVLGHRTTGKQSSIDLDAADA
jgi:hypothetical protein